jgi:hypothetical protein
MVAQHSAGGRRSLEREQAWRQAFAEQVQSGWSVARFCRQRGLTKSSFYFWRGELARRDAERKRASQATSAMASPKMSFVQLGVASASSDADRRDRKAAPIVIQWGSIRVEVPGGFDRETLAQVLAILQESFAQRGASC